MARLLLIGLGMNLDSPWMALAGGVIIGISAALLMLSHGRIAGISGIWGGLLNRPKEAGGFRIFFALGMLGGGAVLALLLPAAFASSPAGSASVVGAGLLVGYGTQTGGGCTSGHGVCGIGRLSTRSLIATATFMAAGFLTVFVTRHVMGGAA